MWELKIKIKSEIHTNINSEKLRNVAYKMDLKEFWSQRCCIYAGIKTNSKTKRAFYYPINNASVYLN